MQLTCGQCLKVIEFSGAAPSFCGYCGKPLAAPTPVTTGYDAEAATLPPREVDPLAETLPPDGSASPLPGSDPQSVGKYRLLRLLGSGGMGRVYEAEHGDSGQRVALKLIAAEFARARDAVERFRQEGRLASGIGHPRCVFVLEADEDAGRPFIAMELMPGSTLQELVQRDGPLPVAQAIRRILDVIDGLREAHRLGVIHRDVKPSNCFIESSGRVKIGDFGLSKSLIADANLTRTGTFLGTPLYASPEQVRGEQVDAQSDVYSVAATLYFLLTGRAPFQTGDMAATLARIVSDDPPSLRSIHQQLPPSLDRVVLRGLARQRDRRYRDLDEFARALLPFIEDKLSVGSVGVRFGAFLIDWVLLTIVNLPLNLPLAQQQASGTFHNPGWFGLLAAAVDSLLWALYFGVFEGLGGCGLGKWLLGLRVARATDIEPPGLLRAVARTAIVALLLGLGNYLACVYALTSMPAIITQEQVLNDWRALGSLFVVSYTPPCWGIIGTLVLVSTMRARNGYRMLQDWLTGTRVIRELQREVGTRLNVPTLEDLLRPAQLTRLGPYEVEGCLDERQQRTVLVGRDPKLGRRVWIELMSAGAPPVPPARRELSRATRLRWLACGVHDARPWDAYLFVSGCPLALAVSARRPLSWRAARPLLTQLTNELAAAETDGTRPTTLTTEQIWVQQDGRLVLLDAPLTPTQSDSTSEAPGDDIAQGLIGQTAALALEGKPRPAARSRGSVRTPLPLHARRLLDPLLGVGSPYPGLDALRTKWQETRESPTEVTRLRRAGQLLIMGVCACSAGLGFLLMTPILLTLIFHIFTNERANAFERVLYQYERLQAAELVSSAALADNPGTAVTLATPWPPDDWIRLSLRYWRDHHRSLTDYQRRTAGPITGFYLTIFDQQANMFKEMQGRFVPRTDLRFWGPIILRDGPDFPREGSEMGPTMCLACALPWPILAVLWSGVLRGALSHYFMGMTLVRRNGRRAGVLRCAWRALLVWLPVTACFLGAGLLTAHYWSNWVPGDVHAEQRWLADGLWYLGCGLLFTWFLLGVLYPRRGPHDVLAGTYLVPR